MVFHGFLWNIMFIIFLKSSKKTKIIYQFYIKKYLNKHTINIKKTTIITSI